MNAPVAIKLSQRTEVNGEETHHYSVAFKGAVNRALREYARKSGTSIERVIEEAGAAYVGMGR